MTFTIKYSGVMLGKQRTGYVNPEKGEYDLRPEPEWFTNDFELACNIASIYNQKKTDYGLKLVREFKVFEIHTIKPESYAIVQFEKPYWEVET